MKSPIKDLVDQAIQYFNKNSIDHAENLLKKVLALQKNNPIALEILGLIKAIQGDHINAINYFKQATKVSPNNPSSQFNLATTYSMNKNDTKAIVHFEKALQLSPNQIDYWVGYGNSLVNVRHFDKALFAYDRALSILSSHPKALLNKGALLNQLKRHDEAIAHYDKALELNPEYVDAWSNKGVALNQLKRHDEAIAHYDKALELNPQIDWLYGNWLHTKMQICNWEDFNENINFITKKVTENEKITTPFPLLAITDNASILLQSSKLYAKAMFPLKTQLGPINRNQKNKKIRIGYFSADFRNHPLSYLTADLFKIHDRNRFEIYAFSFVSSNDEMQLYLSTLFDEFIDVENKTDIEIAMLSRELMIDIAVDLSGYTQDSRVGIFSYRAAPIQISYLGYLGTMGNTYIDYILADDTIIPENFSKFYSEKIAYLPNYQVTSNRRNFSTIEFNRQQLGLPENSFIFCCFNNNYKIQPETFDSWMRIIEAVKGSILYLYAGNKWVETNLKNEALNRGIDPNRIVFGMQLPYDEYLSRYRLCDLFLDTFPYNAGTTASDALWAGLPVLTLKGESFASRVAASILKSIGLSELVTTSRAEYEALAVRLAIQKDQLKLIKKKLEIYHSTMPLFDTKSFTKNLESTYIKIIDKEDFR